MAPRVYGRRMTTNRYRLPLLAPYALQPGDRFTRTTGDTVTVTAPTERDVNDYRVTVEYADGRTETLPLYASARLRVQRAA